MSSSSPEICKLSNYTVERSQTLEEVGLQAFPTTSLGLYITALDALEQSYGAEPPCCLDVRFPARHDISSAPTSHKGL